MKRWLRQYAIKYIFDLLVIFAAFFFAYEMKFNLTFSCNPHSYLVIDSGVGTDSIQSVESLVSKYDVHVVRVIKNYSDTQVDYYVQGDRQVTEQFLNSLDLSEGTYHSMISSQYHVVVRNWDEDVPVYKNSSCLLYFVAEGDARQVLPADAIRALGVDDLEMGNRKLHQQISNYLILIFAITVVILVLLEFYQIFGRTRQDAVKMLFGHSLVRMIGTNLFLNSIDVVAGSIMFLFLLRQFYHISIDVKIVALVILAYFGITFGGTLAVTWTNWRRNLISGKQSKLLMVSSYALRFIVLVIIISLINSGYGIVKNYREMSVHAAFYQYFQEYAMLNADYPDSDLLYCDLAGKEEVALFESIGLYEDRDIVIVNRNSCDYLEGQNSSFSYEKEWDNQIIVFVPEEIWQLDETKVESCLDAPIYENVTIRYVTYGGSAVLPALSGNSADPGTTDWATNPIIIGDFRTDFQEYRDECMSEFAYIWRMSYLIHTDSAKIEMDYDTFELNNVYDEYHQSILPSLMLVRTMALFILILFAMEVMLTVRIVFLEFQMNALHYLAPRVMGAGLISTYQFLYGSITVLMLFGLVASLVVPVEEHWLLAGIVVSAVMLLAEYIIHTLCIYILEKKSLMRVLKGGIL